MRKIFLFPVISPVTPLSGWHAEHKEKGRDNSKIESNDNIITKESNYDKENE